MRIEQLTFTRFIAAVSIVIFHYGQGSILFNNNYVSSIFTQASVGVSYFFILSGFVMIIAYGNKQTIDATTYLKNRFARIYPAYFIALLSMLAFWLLARNFHIIPFLLNLFMIQSWVPGMALTFNVPGWSLSVELLFYLVFPFFFNRIYRNYTFKTLAIPIILFWVASQILHILIQTDFYNIPLVNKDMLYFPLMHLNEFLIGNLAGLYFMKYGKDRMGNFDIFIIIFFCLTLVTLEFPIKDLGQNGLLAILFVPLIILLAMNNGKLTSWFEKKPLVFLGEISYGIYIFHYPIWSWVTDFRLQKFLHLDRENDFTVSFFIRLSLTISLSGISYVYFETPLRKKIQNFKLKSDKAYI